MLRNRKALLCHYHYDPLDRLVDCAPFTQATIRRFYLNGRLATEIQGEVQSSIMQHEDQLLAHQHCQNGTAETRLLATDQQRSVLSALKTNLPCPQSYTPYGHRPLGNGLLSLLGFNGEWPDPVTGHYLLGNGYRAFNPVLMRFNSPDSWSPFGKGGVNTYAYCQGDPLNLTDPTGHIGESIMNLLSSAFSRLSSAARRAIDVTPTPTFIHKANRGFMENIRPLNKDLYTHTDLYKNKTRLNISTHGTLSTSDTSSVVFSNNKPINAEQLISTLKKNGIDPSKFDELRLISCFSADGTNSLIKQLSNLTKKNVKGYSGKVNSSHLPEEIWLEFLEAKKENPKSPQRAFNARMSEQFHSIRKQNPHNFITQPTSYISHNFKSIRITP